MTAEGRFDNHCGSSIEWVHRDMGCSKNGTVFWLMFLHIFEGENENLWTLGVPPFSGKAISRIISNPVFFGQPLTDWDAKISKGRDGVGMVLMPSLRQWTIHFARKIFETCASDIPPQLMINVRLLFSKKTWRHSLHSHVVSFCIVLKFEVSFPILMNLCLFTPKKVLPKVKWRLHTGG